MTSRTYSMIFPLGVTKNQTQSHRGAVIQGTCSGWIWAAYTHVDAQEGVAQTMWRTKGQTFNQ